MGPPPPRADLPGTSRGPVRLEPLGVGQTIDASIRLFRARWKVLMATTALIVVPFTLLEQFAIHVSVHPVLIGGHIYQDQPNFGVTSSFALANFLLIQPLTQAALIRAIAGIYLGQKVSVGESIRFGLSKFGWVLLAIFLATLLTLFGLLALVIGAVYIYIKFYFAIPAVIVEDAKGDALGRSWRLTKGRWWHIFGTALLAFILAAIVAGILSIPPAILTVGGTEGGIAWVVRAVFSGAASVIVTPFTLGVTVLLYFDARIRKEGFDLAVMAREVGAGAP
jgi:hypothetical protein